MKKSITMNVYILFFGMRFGELSLYDFYLHNYDWLWAAEN